MIDEPFFEIALAKSQKKQYHLSRVGSDTGIPVEYFMQHTENFETILSWEINLTSDVEDLLHHEKALDSLDPDDSDDCESDDSTAVGFEDTFKALLQDSLKEQQSLEGKIVKGHILAIDQDALVVNVSSKSEGRVPLKEFTGEERAQLKVGGEVDVYIERYEGRNGSMILSRQKALQEVTWQKLTQAYEDREPVSGTVLGMVRGGLSVNLGGTIAFLPGSQIDIRPFRDSGELVGTEQKFLIIKIDEARGNIVVSRRAVLERERASDKAKLLAKIEQGMVLTGVVKNLAPYGAFIDLGGIDGLLHTSDLSYNKRVAIEDVLEVGQELQVMVIRFNRENERISLGLRQLIKDPWQTVNETYKIGDIVNATITNVTNYGAFAELSEGIEGLIHVREMLWHKKDVDPHEVVAPKDEVRVMVLEIDATKRRISLGLKQCTENVFEKFANEHPVGSQLEVEVKDVTKFGVHVVLPYNIEFAVHKSELSWTLPPEETLGKYHVGQKVRVKVTKVSPSEEFIGLSIKQLSNDQSSAYLETLQKGDTVKTRIIRVSPAGLEVELAQGVLSFISRNELGDQNAPLTEIFEAGTELEAKVVKLNAKTQQLVLSVKALEREEQSRVLSEFAKNPEQERSLESAFNKALDEHRRDVTQEV